MDEDSKTEGYDEPKELFGLPTREFMALSPLGRLGQLIRNDRITLGLLALLCVFAIYRYAIA
jgi:hypothetical protein